MKKVILILFFIQYSLCSFAQKDSSLPKKLDTISIRVFEMNQRLKEIPAAVNYVGSNALQRFSNTSIVSAVNSTPGIKMEERSPGSYRINIRGSSLRSPFGVRNVKVYFNDIPITDPGGLTYLNQLVYYNIKSLGIIKGPGSSIYGAGTGGVLLIENTSANMEKDLTAELSTGSFDMYNIYGSGITKTENASMLTGFQHQQCDGYRANSKMRRDVLAWTGNFSLPTTNIKATFLYGDLYYQTPGALTKTEFENDPRRARPGSGVFPGAEAARAAIYQKQVMAGVSVEQGLLRRMTDKRRMTADSRLTAGASLTNRSVVYGMFTDFKNPAIQNYGHNEEQHGGLRTVFTLENKTINLQVGTEIQKGFTGVNIHKNVSGNPDSLRTHDDINVLQAMAFVQNNIRYDEWSLTAGASLNYLKINFQRFSPATSGKQNRSFNNQIAPRIALMKRFGNVNAYTSISKGFSPPTTSELLPTGGAVNLDLDPEQGWNHDIGVKANIHDLYVDINAFLFSLKNTIVLRRNAGGGDYYLNAGKTSQHGIESSFSYPLSLPNLSDRSSVWLSYTLHDFKYKEFVQLTNDFSVNKMPSVAKHIIASGADVNWTNGLLFAVTYYYSSRVALNDANTEYASAYHLVGAKAGYEKATQKFRIRLVAGIDNLLNQVYSLGNDINGFGGRYYNAAPLRNYYASIILHIK